MKSKAYAGKPGTGSVPMSRRKRFAFSLIVLLFPLMVLAAAEVSLRLIDYGGNLDLVVRRTIGGREFFTINRAVGKRYFAGTVTVVPEPHEDNFAIAKFPGTKRVFCLGESTMEGFPYEFNATAPSFLKDRLRTMYPGSPVEVINVGLSAVGSWVVKDFMREVLAYEPDLIVVYVGHNEFYGAYGPGSVVAVRGGPWLTQISIALLRFRTYLLLRDAYIRIGSAPGGKPAPGDATLMQQVVGTAEIPYGSETYRRGLEIYRGNLNDIITSAQASGVPIMFSALVSNLRDQPPFTSIFSPGSDAIRRRLWEERVAAGDSALSQGDIPGAIGEYRTGTELDTVNADGFYRLGKALAGTGRYDDARRAFIRAKDEDALRFRATEEFQETLFDVCRKRNVPLSRVDTTFAAASPHGIIGHELIVEHLHPDIAGYFLMAKTWAADIRAAHLLGPEPPGGEILPDSTYMDSSAVTAFDEELGKIKTGLIKRHWPFTRGNVSTSFIPGDSVQAIVYAYIRHAIGWSDARYALAAYYGRHAQFRLARRECLAVWRVIPFSFQPLLKLADYFSDEGNTHEAEAAYERCIGVEDNPFARMKLGLLMLQEDRASDAAREIEEGFAVNGKGAGSLPVGGTATGRYLLGVAYAKLGKFEEAKDNLRKALVIQPDLREARDVLSQIP
jgi:tetratricopeptide (TPR) repeat protein